VEWVSLDFTTVGILLFCRGISAGSTATAGPELRDSDERRELRLLDSVDVLEIGAGACCGGAGTDISVRVVATDRLDLSASGIEDMLRSTASINSARLHASSVELTARVPGGEGAKSASAEAPSDVLPRTLPIDACGSNP
jgi:hypothetical protein